MESTAMENTNEMKLVFDSRPANEGLARVAVAAFCTQLNPTLEEVADLKTAVSEAVTNCILHAYDGKVEPEETAYVGGGECKDYEVDPKDMIETEQNARKKTAGETDRKSSRKMTGEKYQIELKCRLEGQELSVDVIDHGVGISDIKKAMEPLFTTKPEKDRSGMGFTFMEAFMDELTVESQVGKGTTVHMKKVIGR